MGAQGKGGEKGNNNINLHTPRVDWGTTFEHLILNRPRADGDVVKTLPDAFSFFGRSTFGSRWMITAKMYYY